MPVYTASTALFIQDTEGSGSDSEDDEGDIQFLHFLILTPGYAVERLVLSAQLPATEAEILARAAAVRKQDVAFLFPHLCAARPQPVRGSGLLVASPFWVEDMTPSRTTVCFDSTRVDGRIYAKDVPTYLHHQQLLCIAGLQNVEHVTIYAGVDHDELDSDAWCHVSGGDTITFATPGSSLQPCLCPYPSTHVERFS